MPASIASLASYAPQAAKLFGTMIAPSSILAGSMIALGLTAAIPLKPDEKETVVASTLRLMYPILALMTLSSELLAVIWATIAVNQLTETDVPMTESVWHLLSNEFALQWAAVNSHFVFGMFGFMVIIAIRLYFMCGQGGMGLSAVGLTMSVLMFMISIVNRAVATGGGNGIRYGTTVLALFERYFSLFMKRAVTYETFGAVEVLAVATMIVSLLTYLSYAAMSFENRKNKEA